jgi:curli biogenesis system outer membrane secretion channel CsgG
LNRLAAFGDEYLQPLPGIAMKSHHLLSTSLIAVSLAAFQPALANSPAVAQPGAGQAQMSATKNDLPPIAGPKITIAVGKIDVTSGATSSGAMTTSPAITAMLATALEQSGRFIVAERDNLNQVINEQELAANKLTQGSAAPAAGNVIPAQYIVVGSVSELSDTDRGSSFGIGFGGIGLSLSGQKGSVALDLRLVNTRTGQVEDSFTLRKALSSTGIGLSGGWKQITLGGNQLWNTPLGETLRAALNEAADRIAASASKGGWDALVAAVEGDTVYVNAGSDAGLKIGDHLVIERIAGALTDPATNLILTVQKVPIAKVELTAVDGKFATGTLVQSTTTMAQRGDTVVFAR